VPFRFNMLLQEAAINPEQVRLLRHQPRVGGKATLDVWRTDRVALEGYQSLQPLAKRAHLARPFWASFIGTWDGRTLFSGLYRVGEPQPVLAPITVPLSGAVEPPGTLDHYPTDRLDLLQPYEGKLYVDWGGGSSGKRAWIQRAEARDKIITELHLGGPERPFPGLMELSTPLSTLATAPPEWIQALSAAQGVYLLTCPRDGGLYVGAAIGEDGFWSRWSDYRANGHGGNVALLEREASDYVVSILQVAGSADADDVVLAMEERWKNKLQSRHLGLNRN
jgi:hypothetical protein